MLDFAGSATGIADDGTISGWAETADRSHRAVRVRCDGSIEDLGVFRGDLSESRAVGVDELVVGLVSVGSRDEGQLAYRPAAWFRREDAPRVLEDFGCTWGQAIDVNSDGTVLIWGLEMTAPFQSSSRGILWKPLEGRWQLIGGDPALNIVAVGLNGVGVALGFTYTKAVVRSP